MPAAVSTAQVVPSDADLAATRCTSGEEKFLPADFYYCLATQSYGQKQYGAAKRFFTSAAGWASKPAQYVLGVMALDGDHQRPDRALALAWFSLAAERPDSHFAAAYNELLKQTTPREREDAKNLLAKMQPVYGDATAAKRAQERYESGMASLKNKESYCMAGTQQLGDDPIDPQSCPPVQLVVTRIDKAAEAVFDGWQGHVTVGSLQQVHQP
jgi:TPR repeat protein